jgi:hypothetical protein
MIVIEKGAKTRLPKPFHSVNNICAYLYDQITEILSDIYYVDMANTTINDESEVLKKALDEDGLHPFDAFKKLGYNDALEVVVTKHVTMSIIADLVNFVYESIIIAQKGKISVAYALLRKPFTDQLLILEQIVADRKDFIDRYFYDGDPQKYDPSAANLDRKKIIEKSVEKLKALFYSSDLIYELRYDKSSEIGLNAYTNHALHIVTNHKHYKTENQGLNFTFPLSDEDLFEFLNHYYSAVSVLLNYLAAVADHIVFDLIEDPERRREEKTLKRFVAFIMLYDDGKRSLSKTTFSQLSKLLVHECEICKTLNKFTKRDFENYFYSHYFTCKRCFNPLQLPATVWNNIGKILYRVDITEIDDKRH